MKNLFRLPDKNMRKSVFFLFAILFLFSCNNDPEGYSHTKSGLVYRFTIIGDGAKPAVDNYIKFKYVLKTMNDSSEGTKG